MSRNKIKKVTFFIYLYTRQYLPYCKYSTANIFFTNTQLKPSCVLNFLGVSFSLDPNYKDHIVSLLRQVSKGWMLWGTFGPPSHYSSCLLCIGALLALVSGMVNIYWIVSHVLFLLDKTQPRTFLLVSSLSFTNSLQSLC